MSYPKLCKASPRKLRVQLPVLEFIICKKKKL